ncbi:MAG: NlpC/P60 family protein [Rothia sp. (in: high G+C Gram-positive bacteria)]|nr:NlpC/P60 family protein [Rothia sp. (in: high G+C Gram-positive bacteria)]
MAKSTARHMAAKKSNVVRNAGIAAVASAAVMGSVVPANAFAMAAAPAPATTSPSLATYETPSYSYDYSTWNAQAETTSYQAPAVQTSYAPQSSNVNLSGARQAILAAAYDGIGGAYIWGGKAYKGWDCSGFVSHVYAQAGINLTAYTYAMAGELVPTAAPQPGDVVFTNGFSHVGIYVGDGKMISALNPTQGTLESAVDGGGFMPVDGYYTFAGI